MRSWKITFGIEDGSRNTGYMAFWVNSGGPDVILEERNDPYHFAQELAGAIAPLLAGAIRFIHIFEAVPVPAGIPSVPGALSDIEERARWKWKTVGNHTTQFLMPAVDESIFTYNSDGVSVDITNPDVAAFVVIMTHPLDLPGDWTIAPVDARGADITDLIEAKEYFG